MIGLKNYSQMKKGKNPLGYFGMYLKLLEFQCWCGEKEEGVTV